MREWICNIIGCSDFCEECIEPVDPSELPPPPDIADTINANTLIQIAKAEFGEDTPILIPDNYYELATMESFLAFLASDNTNKYKYTGDPGLDCITGDTPIICKKDNNITIKELQELTNEYQILDCSGEWTNINWIKSKVTDKEVITKTIRKCGTISLTEDHNVLHNNEYIKFKDTNEIDIISIGKYFKSNNTISEELAWVYGLFFSDGHCKCYTKPLVKKWQSMFYTTSYNKKVPDIILHSNENIVRAFLDGVFQGDGTKSDNPIKKITIHNHIALFGIQVLLEKIGEDYEIRIENNRDLTWNISYNKTQHTQKSIPHWNRMRKETIVYDINTDSGNLIACNFKIKNCDDFASILQGRASIPGWSTVPIGTIWCTTPNHALNWFVDENKKLYLVEPQTDRVFLDDGTYVPYILWL